LKEFTVYPKKKKVPTEESLSDDLLLMLREDGSFQQFQDDEDDIDEDEDADNNDGAAAAKIDDSWKTFALRRQQRKLKLKHNKEEQLKEYMVNSVVKGVWDIIDGNKLILAADRPDQPKNNDNQSNSHKNNKLPSSSSPSPLSTSSRDTLLVGRVVADYKSSLQDNPALSLSTNATETAAAPLLQNARENQQGNEKISTKNKPRPLDTHLSVPKGSVKVGKFFYPQKHPSFFDQPMFQPARHGSFRLRQVLGSGNAAGNDDDEEQQLLEKFRRSDFYNRTFLLTSQPLGTKRPKGSTHWSIKQNKYVEDQQKKEQESRLVHNLRVLQVSFFSNNTFSTVAGLGGGGSSGMVLRGKFDIVGQNRDQLWMQISRFGFGRSVSGSVFSEGHMLTHEDAKTYWGSIKYEGDGEENSENKQSDGGSGDDANGNINPATQRLEIKGTVLFGIGIEPTPVARFMMRETSPREADLSSEGGVDEDDDEVDEDAILDLLLENDNTIRMGDDGIDWTLGDGEEGNDAFQ